MITRRDIMVSSLALAGGATLSCPPSCDRATEITGPTPPPGVRRPDQLIHLAPHVLRLTKWKAGDLFTFCNAMRENELKSLAKGLELPEFTDGQTKPEMLSAIHTELVWQSSNILSYAFKSIEEIDYHRIVAWCAQSVGVDSTTTAFTSTFDLEQAVVKKQFVELWDKLPKDERIALLEKIDTEHALEDRAAIAAMSGSAALAALSTTVYFTGFAFTRQCP